MKDEPGQLKSTLSPGRKFVMSLSEYFRKLILLLALFLFALGAAGAGIGYAAQNLRDFSLVAHGITIKLHAKSTVQHLHSRPKPKTPKAKPSS